MNKNSTIAALKAAKSKHEKAQAALEKIQSVVTGRDLPGIDSGAIDKARLDLADCLALRIVGEADEADEKRARATLQTAEREFSMLEESYSVASLGMAGLNRMLLAAQQAKDNAAQDQAGAVNDWIFEELRIADKAFVEHAAELMHSYNRVVACVKSLNRRGASKIGNFAYSPELVNYVHSQDLAIPVIGPVSAAVFNSMYDYESNKSAGKLLYSASRVSPHQPENDEIERDLSDVMKSTDSILGRIIKSVGGL